MGSDDTERRYDDAGRLLPRYDPTCNPPHSEDPAYLWSRDAATLALEVAASVVRRLSAKHRYVREGHGFPEDLRNALDRELTAALKGFRHAD